MTDPIRFKLGLAGGLVTDAEGDWITYRTHVAAIARLTYERDEWREADRAECAESARLRAALRTYGRHHDTCGDMDGYNGVHPVRCDCGLDELREEG